LGGEHRADPNRAGLFINLIPAFATLLSVWLLGESIQVFHIAGMGFIVGGMALFYFNRV
jgi:drug/metabolite transporter (DMT)-like permease